MSTQNPLRVAAGVSDGTKKGGQFAVNPQSEDVEVAELTGPAPTVWQQLDAAYKARHQLNDDIERLSAQAIADNIRDRFPDAAAVVFADSDQGPHFDAARIVDGQGNTLHDVDGWDDDDDGDLQTLASNFDNDNVSPLLTNKGTRRNPAYQLNLDGHSTAEKEEMPRAEGVRQSLSHINQQATIDRLRAELSGDPQSTTSATGAPRTAALVANQPLPHVPLADIHPATQVYVDHPEIQSGAVRDKVLSADGTTVFRRRREGVFPVEPYQMRFQTSRPIDDDEMQQMASLVGYAYASKVRGEPLDDPVRDSPYSFVVYADTTKSRRDDVGQALKEFEAELPKMVRDGSPIRTTDRTGPAGTRAVLGLNDPVLTFETYYDSVYGEDA